jgi:hypothetical protein
LYYGGEKPNKSFSLMKSGHEKWNVDRMHIRRIEPENTKGVF